MKTLLLLLLMTSGLYAQKQVFNVQKYCIDETPGTTSDCDVSGNAYSFVFLDNIKNEVVLFLTDSKFKYQITKSEIHPTHTSYTLNDGNHESTMKVNTQKTRIEFLTANRNIFLTVGKSTKS